MTSLRGVDPREISAKTSVNISKLIRIVAFTIYHLPLWIHLFPPSPSSLHLPSCCLRRFWYFPSLLPALRPPIIRWCLHQLRLQSIPPEIPEYFPGPLSDLGMPCLSIVRRFSTPVVSPLKLPDTPNYSFSTTHSPLHRSPASASPLASPYAPE